MGNCACVETINALSHFATASSCRPIGAFPIHASKTVTTEAFIKQKGSARRCLAIQSPGGPEFFVAPDGDRAEWVGVIGALKAPLASSMPSGTAIDVRSELASPQRVTRIADYSAPPSKGSALGVSVAGLKYLQAKMLQSAIDSNAGAAISKEARDPEDVSSWAKAQWIERTGPVFVGYATVYVSCPWATGLSDLIDAVMDHHEAPDDTTFYWIDFTTPTVAVLNDRTDTAATDRLETTRSTMQQCDQLLIVTASNCDPPAALSAWPILEAVIASNVLGDDSIDVVVARPMLATLKRCLIDGDTAAFATMLTSIDSYDSKSDGEAIAAVLEGEADGHERAKHLYRDLMRDGVTQIVTGLIKEEEGNGDGGAVSAGRLAHAAAVALRQAGDNATAATFLHTALAMFRQDTTANTADTIAVLSELVLVSPTIGEDAVATVTWRVRAETLGQIKPIPSAAALFLHLDNMLRNPKPNLADALESMPLHVFYKMYGSTATFPLDAVTDWYSAVHDIVVAGLDPTDIIVTTAERNWRGAVAAKAHPLIFAATVGTAALITSLVATNVDVNACRETDGATPLVFAALHRRGATVIQALLDGNADPNKAAASSGVTPLIAAVQYQHVDVVQALATVKALAKVSDVNLAAGHDRVTALALAAHRGNVAMCTELLLVGAEVDKADGIGRTPLFVAAEQGHEALVRKLIRVHNANPNLGTHSGWTPFRVATHRRHHDIVKVLRASGAADSLLGGRLSADEIDLSTSPEPTDIATARARPDSLYSMYLEDGVGFDSDTTPAGHVAVGVPAADGIMRMILEQEAASARRQDVESRQHADSLTGGSRPAPSSTK